MADIGKIGRDPILIAETTPVVRPGQEVLITGKEQVRPRSVTGPTIEFKAHSKELLRLMANNVGIPFSLIAENPAVNATKCARETVLRMEALNSEAEQIEKQLTNFLKGESDE